MLKKLNLSFGQLVSLLGKKVLLFIFFSMIVGILWFLIDSSFIIILQAFMVSMNLIDPVRLNLPQWMPTDASSAAIGLVCFTAFRGIVWGFKNFFASATSNSFVREQRSRILELGLRNSNSMNGHEIITAFSDHILKAGTSLFFLTHLFSVATAIIFFSCYAFYTAPKEFLVSMMILMLIIIPVRLFDKKIKTLSSSLNEERALTTKTLINGLKNNFFLRISGMIETEISRGIASLKKYENHYRQFEIISSARSATPMFIGGAVVGTVYYLSSHYFGTSSAQLLTFFYLLLRIAQGTSEVVYYSGEVQVNMFGFRSLLKISKIFEKAELNLQLSTQQNTIEVRDISLNNVSFSYDQNILFKNINLDLKKGDSLLILGESGSGKSTLLSLIIGLLKPTTGTVKINDEAAEQIFPKITDHIAYVGPEPYLIADSIKENLLYGLKNRSLGDIDLFTALKEVKLDALISSFKSGLNEQLHDMAQISTGQKQRLSLARALLRSPQILLLDEATANLDSDTESIIIEMLKKKSKNLITIIISHKNSFSEFDKNIKVINLNNKSK